MKHLLSFAVLFTTITGSIQDVRSAAQFDAENAVTLNFNIHRQEVVDISAIRDHVTTPGKKMFFIDADEVLFTSAVSEDGTVSLVPLYPDLGGLLSEIRRNGHKAYIMTYNKAEEISRKLIAVGLSDSYFDGILSCEMQGDLMTAKGDLLKSFVERNGPVPVAVFIDNFPPFVKNVEQVASELGIKLYSYLCTGYIDLYHAYVYHYLQEIADELKNGKDVSEKTKRIQGSLEKYEIDLSSFKETYPTYESFKAWADEKKLIWPYLTYL